MDVSTTQYGYFRGSEAEIRCLDDLNFRKESLVYEEDIHSLFCSDDVVCQGDLCSFAG